MSQWIEHPSEPKRLVLTWEAPLGVSNRTRWVVGELKQLSGQASFRYLKDQEFRDANNGRGEDQLRAAGYLGYPAFDPRGTDKTVFDDHVLEAFLRRLPPPQRADFGSYLEHFRIPSTSKLSAFALLGATEARLPGDGFSLIDPFDPEQDVCEAVLEVAGHRHYQGSRSSLMIGERLELIPELGHPHDANAVKISASGGTVGYINRVQAPTVTQWISTRKVEAFLLRLNGSPAKPRAFVFLKVRPVAVRKAA